MKNLYQNIFLLLAVLFLASCGNEEDVSPSYADSNIFAPQDSDKSYSAELRREFFSETGTYLLFNDTLSVVPKGVDCYGNVINDVQTVDVDFTMFSTSSDHYTYTYEYLVGNDVKRQAVDAFKEGVVKRLGSLKPFSFLLVDYMTQWTTDDYGEPELTKNPYPLYRLGSRCYVISLNHGEGLTNSSYFDNIVYQIVLSIVLQKNDSFFSTFFGAISDYSNLVGQYKADIDYPNGYDDDMARSLGFLRDGNKWYMRNKTGDITDYVSAVFDYTEEEFTEKYGEYPICVTRYQAMRNLLLSMGVVLNK